MNDIKHLARLLKKTIKINFPPITVPEGIQIFLKEALNRMVFREKPVGKLVNDSATRKDDYHEVQLQRKP
jgi:hypothetical protein